MPAAAAIALPGVAFDLESVHDYDSDGHLHVSTANISKAAVNPYVGREIPGWQSLGLDPEKIYNLLRDPKELARGASTFAGKPILLVHQAISANDHPREVVIGAIGDDVQFRDPYLTAPLTIWDGQAIKLIESGAQRQLSAGYRYTPILASGLFRGEPYDIRMADISGNHLAIVQNGRAGSEVVVGDAAPDEIAAFQRALNRVRTEEILNRKRESRELQVFLERANAPQARRALEEFNRLFPEAKPIIRS